MKIKAIAAAGAIGLGMGVAGLVGAGTASAQPNPPPGCGESPIGITPGNIVCNIQSNGSSFAMSVSPGYNLGVLLNGTEDSPDLGLLDWPTTFVTSVQDFASGPRAPGGPSPVDTTAPGEPPA